MQIFKKIFLILTLFYVNFSYAETTKLNIVRSDGNYPPNEFTNKEGKLIGIHFDIIEAVAKKINWTYNIASFPWKRCIKMMKGGEADAIMYIQKSTDREKFLWFENNILTEGSFSFIVRKQDEEKIKYNGDIKDFAKEYPVIGTISGFYYPPIVNEAGFRFEKNENEPRMIEKLIRKRMDIALAEKSAVTYLTKHNHTFDKIAFIHPEIVRFNIYIAFSKKLAGKTLDKELAQKRAMEFSQELEKFKKTKEYKDILGKYEE